MKKDFFCILQVHIFRDFFKRQKWRIWDWKFQKIKLQGEDKFDVSFYREIVTNTLILSHWWLILKKYNRLCFRRFSDIFALLVPLRVVFSYFNVLSYASAVIFFAPDALFFAPDALFCAPDALFYASAVLFYALSASFCTKKTGTKHFSAYPCSFYLMNLQHLHGVL